MRTHAHVGTLDKHQHFYYSARWQVLETRETAQSTDQPESANPQYQYVWSLRYIDAPICRDSDGAGLTQRVLRTT